MSEAYQTVAERVTHWRESAREFLAEVPTPEFESDQWLGQQLIKLRDTKSSPKLEALCDFYQDYQAALTQGVFKPQGVLEADIKQWRKKVLKLLDSADQPNLASLPNAELSQQLTKQAQATDDGELQAALKVCAQRYQALKQDLVTHYQAVAESTIKVEKLADPFSVLGLDEEVTPGEVRKAFMALQKQLHPDTFSNPSAEHIQALLKTHPEALPYALETDDPGKITDYLEQNTLLAFDPLKAQRKDDKQMLYALGYFCLPAHTIDRAFLTRVKEFYFPASAEEAAPAENSPLRDWPEGERDFLLGRVKQPNFQARLEAMASNPQPETVQLKLQAFAHGQFLRVQAAYDQIKDEQNEAHINRSLDGFNWETERLIDGLPEDHFINQRPHDQDEDRCETVNKWGGEDLKAYLAAQIDEADAMAEIIANDDLFYRFVPREVPAKHYGRYIEEWQIIPLETHGYQIARPMKVIYSGKIVRQPINMPPVLRFSVGIGEFDPWTTYHQNIDLETLVVATYLSAKKSLPRALFNQLADRFGWDEATTAQVANMTHQGQAPNDIIKSIGYVLPQFAAGDWREKNPLNASEMSQSSTHTIADQISLIKSLRYHLTRLQQKNLPPKKEVERSIVWQADGSWQLHHPQLNKRGQVLENDEGPRMSLLTITPNEVALIEAMVLGPSLS